jgi:hypothetical protein
MEQKQRGTDDSPTYVTIVYISVAHSWVGEGRTGVAYIGSKARSLWSVIFHRALLLTIMPVEPIVNPVRTAKKINLIFVCPCIIIYSHSTTNKMLLLSQIIYLFKTLYIFRTVVPFIIRSSKLRIQQRYMSNSCCYLLLSGMRWNEVPSHPL